MSEAEAKLNVHFHEIEEGINKGLYVIFSYETDKVNFWHRCVFLKNPISFQVLKSWVNLCKGESYTVDPPHTPIFSIYQGGTDSVLVFVQQSEKFIRLPFSSCKEAFEMTRDRLISFDKRCYLSALEELEKLEKS